MREDMRAGLEALKLTHFAVPKKFLRDTAKYVILPTLIVSAVYIIVADKIFGVGVPASGLAVLMTLELLVVVAQQARWLSKLNRLRGPGNVVASIIGYHMMSFGIFCTALIVAQTQNSRILEGLKMIDLAGFLSLTPALSFLIVLCMCVLRLRRSWRDEGMGYDPLLDSLEDAYNSVRA